ncbi:hypothetical protein Mapa_015641 [Marchantia paleacea]|nr:hypothetical protein Mapa_015641 [Marchantia paleacea]
MNYVIKIKYEDTLRRLTYPGHRPYGDQYNDKLITYAKLEANIRDLFKLPASSQIRVTYTDKDNDVVTMGDDQDLEDACVLQGLNPLRLFVTLLDVPRVGAAEGQAEQLLPLKENGEAVPSLKQILKGLPADVLKPVVDHVQLLLKGTAPSQRELSELVDTVVNTVTSHIDSAVKKVDLTDFLSASGGPSVPTTSQTHPVCSPVYQNSPLPSPIQGTRMPVNIHPNEIEASEAGNASRVFHTGVQCDVCGMSPIVGPRFKSSKKLDYDLCVSCFKEFGNISDYTRIDRPLFRPRHLQAIGNARVRCPVVSPNCHAGRPFSMRGPYGARPDSRYQTIHQMNGSGGKLDARFVQDVTIFDGTELAPGTNFTKIWRLRNSGTLPWPVDTKLVHVGGDELGCVFIVPLELPERGLAPGEEVEASVDLVAPEKPGRYVSHWRLASPSGPKFGHRVWVLIQVVSKEGQEDALINEMSSPSPVEAFAKEDTSSTGSLKSKDLDFTAVHSTQVVPKMEEWVNTFFLSKEYPSGLGSLLTDSDVRALGIGPDIMLPGQTKASVVDIKSPIEVGQEDSTSMLGNVKEDLIEKKDDDIDQPKWKNDAILGNLESLKQSVVGGDLPSQTSGSLGKEKMATDEVASYVNSELGGFSMVEMPQLTSSSSSASVTLRDNANESSAGIVDVSVEEEDKPASTAAELCDKLDGMGFSDRKLNLELLEKNNMDLRRTLDALVGAADWDPILEELEEMGFYDVEMNRRLMFKNNGSVKRVVKELVQMYKEPVASGKGKEMV